MRAYSKISPRFWSGDLGHRLRNEPPHVMLVALYLLTCPSANMIGLYYLPWPLVAHETGLTGTQVAEALARLEALDFVSLDEAVENVWVHEMARYQVGDTLHPKDNRVTGIRNLLERSGTTRLTGRFLARYAKVYHLQDVQVDVAPAADDADRVSGAGAPPQAACPDCRRTHPNRVAAIAVAAVPVTSATPRAPDGAPHGTSGGRKRARTRSGRPSRSNDDDSLVARNRTALEHRQRGDGPDPPTQDPPVKSSPEAPP